MSKILDDIKEAMGLAEEKAFDADLTMAVGAALAIVNQNGVGSEVDFVKNNTLTWAEFMGDSANSALLGIVKQYVYLKAKILFDPPPPSVIPYMDKTVEELLWRIRDGIGGPNF